MKLKAMAWIAIPAGLLLSAADSHAGTCKPEQLNKTFCRQNQTVSCIKQFDPARNKFIYKWEFVNNSGQVFEAPPEMLGKTPGYTPRRCGMKQDAVVELVEPNPRYHN